MKHFRSRHQAISVTVAGVAYNVELAPVGDGWFVGMAEDAVVEKCVGISPSEYQNLGDVAQDEPPPAHDESSPGDTEEPPSEQVSPHEPADEPDVTLPLEDMPMPEESDSQEAEQDDPTKRRGRRNR